MVLARYAASPRNRDGGLLCRSSMDPVATGVQSRLSERRLTNHVGTWNAAIPRDQVGKEGWRAWSATSSRNQDGRGLRMQSAEAVQDQDGETDDVRRV